MLAACTACAVGIHADIIRVDFNFHTVINLWCNIQRRKGSMPAP
ncbi:hypothetical protein SDC9_212823 [bioreactor metagenome]|uniref:Uncharacterized protein n=1 Tax=bioreactor metagenome TaxID=1076179 RepID=A0A645K0E5_9ZZZZ